MLSFNLLLSVCLIYVAVLFAVAFIAEKNARKKRFNFLKSPLIYTLSLSVYCTAWTYYGAVGSAARNGLEFIAIYLGPTLVFIGWWWLLRKLVRIGNTQRITSIADLISSRYGKSTSLGVIITLIAIIGSTPYIALQLQSLTLSFSVFSIEDANQVGTISSSATALWLAVGLAGFTIIFGTRNLDANEHHHGVVTAIAVEAIVKLIALVTVGAFVVWGIHSGPQNLLDNTSPDILQSDDFFTSRWLTLIFLSAAAVICLPRMFQVVVVENSNENHLATASWAFPLYLFLMSLFVLPIAVTGLQILPEGSNPDLFVLTLPLASDQEALAMLAFLGGFSSATSMVIVAAIALSTMVSNHIILPLWLWLTLNRSPANDDVRRLLLRSRRFSIAGILGLGYLYYRLTSGTDGLASIGLIAFAGAAQLLPAIIGGLYWEHANRRGALSGILAGFAIWLYTLLLPSFNGNLILSLDIIENGLFGLSYLKPQALMGFEIEDPLIHAVVWSIGVNIITFIAVSLATRTTSIEQIQAPQFTHVFDGAMPNRILSRSTSAKELHTLSQRILGHETTAKLFNEALAEQTKAGRLNEDLTSNLPEPTNALILKLEREFSGSVGAATAHAMIGQITSGEATPIEDLIAAADETAQIMEYSAKLKQQSSELEKTAGQLRIANTKLRKLGEQKDTFLSQVSHELRTPMTSIRSFAEILRDGSDMTSRQRKHFSSIIHDEAIRLTRLLDEILDLSILERGTIKLNMSNTQLGKILDRALHATQTIRMNNGAQLVATNTFQNMDIETDADRLSQVFINLITNAINHGGEGTRRIEFTAKAQNDMIQIHIIDDGKGIDPENAELIFQKFAKLSSKNNAGSAGLGLAISHEIIRNLGGELTYDGNEKGASFCIALPQINYEDQL